MITPREKGNQKLLNCFMVFMGFFIIYGSTAF